MYTGFFIRNGSSSPIYYEDILLNAAKRRSFASSTEHFYCGCNAMKSTQVHISNEAITFGGSPHSSECGRYLKQLQTALNSKGMNSFISGEPIPLNINWSSGSRRHWYILTSHSFPESTRGITRKGQLSFAEFVYIFLASAAWTFWEEGYPAIGSLEKHLQFELGRFTLRAKNGDLLPIANHIYRKYAKVNESYFFIGRLVGVNEKYSKYVYLYYQLDKQYSIRLSKEEYTDILPHLNPYLPLWICGIVTPREKTVQRKGIYSKYSHSSYGYKETVREEVPTVICFFHTEDHGLLCMNETEARLLQSAVEEGRPVSMLGCYPSPERITIL